MESMKNHIRFWFLKKRISPQRLIYVYFLQNFRLVSIKMQ